MQRICFLHLQLSAIVFCSHVLFSRFERLYKQGYGVLWHIGYYQSGVTWVLLVWNKHGVAVLRFNSGCVGHPEGGVLLKFNFLLVYK